MDCPSKLRKTLIVAAAILARTAGAQGPAKPPAPISIDYPAGGSIFPSDFAPPTFLWRDTSSAVRWVVGVTFAGDTPGIRIPARGERLRIGEIDPRCVSSTNQPPKLTAEQAADRTWQPSAATWEAIKAKSAGQVALVTITGYSRQGSAGVSSARTSIYISKDPVGAPIFSGTCR